MKFLIPSAGHVRRHPSLAMCSGCWRVSAVSGYPLSRDPLTKQKIMSKSPLFRLSSGLTLDPSPLRITQSSQHYCLLSQNSLPPSRPTLLNHVPSTAHLHRPVSASRQWPGPGVMVILLWTRRQPGHVVYCCKCLIITLRFGSLPTQDYNYISARIWASLSASSFLI